MATTTAWATLPVSRTGPTPSPSLSWCGMFPSSPPSHVHENLAVIHFDRETREARRPRVHAEARRRVVLPVMQRTGEDSSLKAPLAQQGPLMRAPILVGVNRIVDPYEQHLLPPDPDPPHFAPPELIEHENAFERHS